MREIKFRAWDVLEEEMIKNVSVHENSLIIKIDTDTSVLTEFVPRFNEQWFKVMQYTSLKDKNGQKIYESDILKWTQRTINGSLQTRACKVFQHKNGAWWIEAHSKYFGETGKKEFQLFNIRKQVEVIGNIYENPHLIQESAK